MGPGAGVDEVDVVLVAAAAAFVRGRRSVIVGRPRPLVRGDRVGGEARGAASASGLGREDGVKPKWGKTTIPLIASCLFAIFSLQLQRRLLLEP